MGLANKISIKNHWLAFEHFGLGEQPTWLSLNPSTKASIKLKVVVSPDFNTSKLIVFQNGKRKKKCASYFVFRPINIFYKNQSYAPYGILGPRSALLDSHLSNPTSHYTYLIVFSNFFLPQLSCRYTVSEWLNNCIIFFFFFLRRLSFFIDFCFYYSQSVTWKL